MKIGDLVRTNAVYAASDEANYGDGTEGLLGIVTSLDGGDEPYPVEVKMLHDGKMWHFKEEELDVAREQDNAGA